jgi:uncharacterized protein (TIGR00661 family)
MTQALALQEILYRAGYTICHVLIGKTETREIPEYFLRKVRAPVSVIPNPELVTGPDGKAVSVFHTVFRNLRNLHRYLAAVRRIHHTVIETTPDVIVNFYSLLAGVYSGVYRPEVPVISVAHQYIMDHPGFQFPPGHRVARMLIQLYTRVTAARSVKKLALSFYPLPDSPRCRVAVVPPLLRTELFTLPSRQVGDYFVGYLLNSGYRDEVIAWHDRNSGVRVHCFLDDPDGGGAASVADGLTMHAINDQAFLRLMAGCRGVICTSGFETVCEALYLDKPVVVVPVGGHFEQLLNALDAERASAAICDRRFALDQFFNHTEASRRPTREFRAWVDLAGAKILDQLEGVISSSRIADHPPSGDGVATGN